jgi:hypothetical protein
MKLSPSQIALIEFANNGVIDSLTETMAPAAFFPALVREALIAKRSGAALMVISLKLNIENLLLQRFDPQSTERFSPNVAVSYIEQEVMRIARVLSESLRVGDLFTRFSDVGFLLVIRGSEWEFQLAEKRIAMNVNGARAAQSHWQLVTVLPDRDEELSHLVARIDRAHFN